MSTLAEGKLKDSEKVVDSKLIFIDTLWWYKKKGKQDINIISFFRSISFLWFMWGALRIIEQDIGKKDFHVKILNVYFFYICRPQFINDIVIIQMYLLFISLSIIFVHHGYCQDTKSVTKDGKPPALAGYPAKLSHLKTIPAKKYHSGQKMSRPLSPRKKRKKK